MNRIVKIGIICFLSVLIFFTIQTYYSSLSQYSTADQTDFSLPRILSSTEKFNALSFNDGSNLSRFLVGIPGKILDNHWKNNHKLGDLVIGDLHYTTVLPYSVFQVFWTLVTLFICVFVLGKCLNLSLKQDLIFFLLIGVFILNIPMFKGDIKVLKYDALSLSCSLAGILFYVYYRTNRKIKLLILSVIFNAFAFLEKDIALLSLIFIIGLELIYHIVQPLPNKKIGIAILKFLGLTFGILTVTVFVFVPKFWTDPFIITELYSRIFMFFDLVSITQIFILLFLLVLLFFVSRIYNAQKKDIDKWFKKKINLQKLFLFLSVLSIGIFISALVYQSNNMFFANNYSDKTFLEKVKKEGYYTTTEYSETSVTTLDKNPTVSKIKFSYNIIRIFTYIIPEIIVCITFLIPLLIFFGFKQNYTDKKLRLFAILGYFPLCFIAFYFLLVPPIEAKYMLSLYLLVTFLALAVFIHFLQNLKSNIVTYSLVILSGLAFIQPIFAANPTHLGYMNIFRSKQIENSEFLDMNVYSGWTWPGWGEATYSLFNYIEKNTTGPQKVFFDYSPPFYFDSRITPIYSAMCRERHMDFGNEQLLDMTTQLGNGGINFIQVSKNVAYRSSIDNFIVKNYRNNAVYIYKVCGIEYGWLFKTKDLMEAVQKNVKK